MYDAAQIRRCSGALNAKYPCSQPPSLAPPPARGPDLKISNRESLGLKIYVTQTKQTTELFLRRGGRSAPPDLRPSFRSSSLRPPPARSPVPQNSNREPLRLEINVIQTKQTAAIGSNREKEALFLTAGRAENRAGLKARPYHGNGEQNSNRESRHSNREESHALQIAINPSAPTNGNRGQLHSKIPNFQPSKKAKSIKNHPQSWFRLERASAVYFQQLTRNLNDTMFRLEPIKGGKKPKQNCNAEKLFGALFHEGADQLRDFVRGGIEGEVAAVYDVDFGFRDVAAIGIWLGGVER